MTTVHIDHRGADVDLDGDRIVVRVQGERKGTLPLNLIDRLVDSGVARLTTRLVAKLAERGVGLVLDRVGRRAGATPVVPTRADRALRLAQYDVLFDLAARLELSRQLVRVKIERGRELLSALDAAGIGNRRELEEGIRRMADAAVLATDATATGDLHVLRGREGAAARAFFPAFASAFAPALDFTGRNRRPPRDPVNVCLSLGYTLAHAEALRIAARHGFDPMLGVYHDLAAGRESLACDLVEPVRSHVDGFVHRIFAEATLRPEDFSGRSENGCALGKTGRRDFYRAFEELCAPALREALDATAREFAAALTERWGRKPAAAFLDAASDRDSRPEAGLPWADER
jgi:CRISP-associated protein Cas1